jgi:undecaprenyl-diphosphatase
MIDLLSLFQAALLGIVEGLTEFIPVSSTGHLILLVDLLGFKAPAGKVFEIVIQLGAILAVCWYYRKKLLYLLFSLPKNTESQHFANAIILAFLPAMLLGIFFHEFIKSVLFSPYVVSVALIVGGFVILYIERLNITPKYDSIERIPYLVPLYIGLAQALAMIPGVSRSGATIMGAVCFKVERKTATEFSFFLAIPTMLGAAVYDVYKNFDVLTLEGTTLIVTGFLAAFTTALLVVKTVIGFINKHGFVPFAYYRIALGVVMLVILGFRA